LKEGETDKIIFVSLLLARTIRRETLPPILKVKKASFHNESI